MGKLLNCTVEMDTTLRAGNELQNTVKSGILTDKMRERTLRFQK
jgi:hypothetical protein